VLRIPTAAVRSEGGVLVLDPTGVLREQAIETGLANWDQTQVSGGLAVGDRVVLSLDRDGVAAGAQARVETEAEAKGGK
jgi:HlyD family secretion protein